MALLSALRWLAPVVEARLLPHSALVPVLVWGCRQWTWAPEEDQWWDRAGLPRLVKPVRLRECSIAWFKVTGRPPIMDVQGKLTSTRMEATPLCALAVPMAGHQVFPDASMVLKQALMPSFRVQHDRVFPLHFETRMQHDIRPGRSYLLEVCTDVVEEVVAAPALAVPRAPVSSPILVPRASPFLVRVSCPPPPLPPPLRLHHGAMVYDDEAREREGAFGIPRHNSALPEPALQLEPTSLVLYHSLCQIFPDGGLPWGLMALIVDYGFSYNYPGGCCVTAAAASAESSHDWNSFSRPRYCSWALPS